MIDSSIDLTITNEFKRGIDIVASGKIGTPLTLTTTIDGIVTSTTNMGGMTFVAWPLRVLVSPLEATAVVCHSHHPEERTSHCFTIGSCRLVGVPHIELVDPLICQEKTIYPDLYLTAPQSRRFLHDMRPSNSWQIPPTLLSTIDTPGYKHQFWWHNSVK